MQLTEKQEFNCTKQQKQTLRVLHKKYKINTSQFIRKAIDEKLIREKETIFKNYREIENYLKKYTECPF